MADTGTTQHEKARDFAALHEGPDCFVIPNPWDAGSARILTVMGFRALATTSAGAAFSIARRDGEGQVGKGELLANAEAIVRASPLPVSADLMACFGDEPDVVAGTIRDAAAVGLVGASVEDSTGRDHEPIYERRAAVDRVAAAVEAARSLPFPFTITARSENFLHGRADLADTIERLQAFQEVGADVLYAPGLTTREQIESVLASVDRPINVLMGIPGLPFTLQDLTDMGVRRVSVGSAMMRVAYAAFHKAASEVLDAGTFRFTEEAMPFGELSRMFEDAGAGS